MPAIKITPTRVREIIDEINKWDTKLTWKALCEHITVIYSFDKTISRHTLLRYRAIEEAFNKKKERLRKKTTSGEEFSGDIQKARQEIEKLQAEVEQLEAKNRKLMEQSARWLKNISAMKGIEVINLEKPTEEVIKIYQELNKPLIKLERSRK
jgi:septal ring factor EnvC (AmiA/AmiB activator)